MPFVFPWINDLRHRSIQLLKVSCNTSHIDSTNSLELHHYCHYQPHLLAVQRKKPEPPRACLASLCHSATPRVYRKYLEMFPPRKLCFSMIIYITRGNTASILQINRATFKLHNYTSFASDPSHSVEENR